jgi:BolA protein
MMTTEAEIRARLQAVFEPDALEVINQSHLHAGHAGDDGSGESHFFVRIRATALAAMPRLARHRAVHAALGPEVMGRVHALALEIS